MTRDQDPSKRTAEQRDTWATFADDYNRALAHFTEFVGHMQRTRPTELSNFPMMIAIMLRADAAVRGRSPEFVLEGVRLALDAIEGSEKILGYKVIDRLEPHPSKVRV